MVTFWFEFASLFHFIWWLTYYYFLTLFLSYWNIIALGLHVILLFFLEKIFPIYRKLILWEKHSQSFAYDFQKYEEFLVFNFGVPFYYLIILLSAVICNFITRCLHAKWKLVKCRCIFFISCVFYLPSILHSVCFYMINMLLGF